MTAPVAVGVTLCVPEAGSAPDHAPLAVQVVPALADHVSVALRPSTIVDGWTESVAVGFFLPPPPPYPPHTQ